MFSEIYDTDLVIRILTLAILIGTPIVLLVGVIKLAIFLIRERVAVFFALLPFMIGMIAFLIGIALWWFLFWLIGLRRLYADNAPEWIKMATTIVVVGSLCVFLGVGNKIGKSIVLKQYPKLTDDG